MTSALKRSSILLVTQYFPPERGAAQVRLGALTDELVRRGYSVQVLTALPNYPTGRIFPGWKRRPVQVYRERGKRVVRVWVWSAMGSGIARMANFASFGLMSLVGGLMVRRPSMLIVEYPTLPGALPAVIVARLAGIRTTVLVADLWVDSIIEMAAIPDRLARWILAPLERWMLRSADVVTVVTEGVRARVIELGVSPDRIAWLPNGVDTTAITPGPADPTFLAHFNLDCNDASRPYVLYAGTHGYVHGLDVLIDAAELLAAANIEVVMVGDGSEKARLQQDAMRRGLDNVRFFDPVSPEDVAGLLRGALAAVATVRAGDLYRTVRSAKVFPAMAAGVPVAYSADDEGSDLVVNAGGGVATPPGDADALADAIISLANDPDRAAGLGRAGRAWVETHASWHQLVGEWLAETGQHTGTEQAAGSQAQSNTGLP